MSDLISFMCFGALILIALLAFFSMSGLMRRLGQGGQGQSYGPTGLGNETPRFDDPFIQSGGSFGGNFGGGNIGSSAPSRSRGATLGGESPRHHDPNVKSGGSFG